MRCQYSQFRERGRVGRFSVHVIVGDANFLSRRTSALLFPCFFGTLPCVRRFPAMINWILLGYMWLYIHRPFEVWTVFGRVRLELLYAICMILVWVASSSEKRELGNIFTPAVFFYTFAIIVATLLSPYTDVLSNGDLYDWLKFILLYVFLLTSVKTEKDLKIVVTGFVVACFLFIGHSYREFLNGRVLYAAGAPRLVGVGVTFSEYNDYGTMIVCFLPLIFPLLTLCKKHWHYLFVLGYLLLTLRSVMLTGSRTAFIMVVSLAILPVLFSRHRLKLIPIVLIVAPIGWMVMPETLQDRYRTIWDPTINEQANVNMRGRTVGFYDGIDNWMNNPLFGVGPAQHGAARGGSFQAHNLPGQVAGETGTLGVMAFLMMLACFGINHLNNWKNYKFLKEKNLGMEGLYCWRVSIAVMYAVMMVLFQGLGLHNAYRFPLVWFGAFQALSTMMLQEKVDAAIKGQLLPKLPVIKKQ